MSHDRTFDPSQSPRESSDAQYDVSVFDRIAAELTENDKLSLLAVQHAVCDRLDSYVYLEIGSHLGGSIQPHLLSRACRYIHSIDPRPAVQSDGRGHRFHYPDNSTERMLENLRALDSERARLVKTYESRSQDLDVGQIAPKPDLVFIDGEHTDAAVIVDFNFARAVVEESAVIIFHDAPIVYGGITAALADLRRRRIAFRSFPMPDTIFVIALGASEPLDRLLQGAGDAYLYALNINDGYRRFYQYSAFRVIRSLMQRTIGSRWFADYGYGRPPGNARRE